MENLPKKEIKLSEHLILHHMLRKHSTNIKQATRDAIKDYGLDKIIKAIPVDTHIELELQDYIAITSKYGRVTKLKRKPGAKRPSKNKKVINNKHKDKKTEISNYAKQQAKYDQNLQQQRAAESRTVTVYVKKARTPKRV